MANWLGLLPPNAVAKHWSTTELDVFPMVEKRGFQPYWYSIENKKRQGVPQKARLIEGRLGSVDGGGDRKGGKQRNRGSSNRLSSASQAAVSCRRLSLLFAPHGRQLLSCIHHHWHAPSRPLGGLFFPTTNQGGVELCWGTHKPQGSSAS